MTGANTTKTTDDKLAIRRAKEADGQAIAELFVTVNRELAPPDQEDDFEAYIELSLEQEITPFLDYYDPAVGNVSARGNDYRIDQRRRGSTKLLVGH